MKMLLVLLAAISCSAFQTAEHSHAAPVVAPISDSHPGITGKKSEFGSEFQELAKLAPLLEPPKQKAQQKREGFGAYGIWYPKGGKDLLPGPKKEQKSSGGNPMVHFLPKTEIIGTPARTSKSDSEVNVIARKALAEKNYDVGQKLDGSIFWYDPANPQKKKCPKDMKCFLKKDSPTERTVPMESPVGPVPTGAQLKRAGICICPGCVCSKSAKQASAAKKIIKQDKKIIAKAKAAKKEVKKLSKVKAAVNKAEAQAKAAFRQIGAQPGEEKGSLKAARAAKVLKKAVKNLDKKKAVVNKQLKKAEKVMSKAQEAKMELKQAKKIVSAIHATKVEEALKVQKRFAAENQ